MIVIDDADVDRALLRAVEIANTAGGGAAVADRGGRVSACWNAGGRIP